MCHGQFYWFDVLDDNSDVIMSEKDISINLQTIVDDATQVPIQDAAKGAVGVLSTENRKVWSGLRDVLTSEPGSNNADSLGISLQTLQPFARTCFAVLARSRKVFRSAHVPTDGTTSFRSLFARTEVLVSTLSIPVSTATQFFDLLVMFTPTPFFDSPVQSMAWLLRSGRPPVLIPPSVILRVSGMSVSLPESWSGICSLSSASQFALQRLDWQISLSKTSSRLWTSVTMERTSSLPWASLQMRLFRWLSKLHTMGFMVVLSVHTSQP
ncbi:hypothetical protein LB505_000464 [Fusarium chuoi]|nr:hypothetical protein LB505_000464 [Fusarium chuoi]